MPSKTKKLAASAASLPTIPKELIDQFVNGPMTGEAVNDACAAFKKALIERALGAEMGLHLGYPPGGAKPAEADNRNGSSAKTVVTDTGKLRIDIPRDRNGSFEPLLIPNTSVASRGLMTRSSAFTPAAYLCARSKLICWRRMAPRSARTSSAR